MCTTKVRIGLAGFGTVGEAFFELIQNKQKFEVVRVLVKDAGKTRCVLPSLLTTDVNEFFCARPQMVVEALSDTRVALKIAQATLREGNILLSANKDLIARHGPELRLLEQQYGGTLLYEAACGAAVPIVRCIDTYFRYEQRPALQAILNSTTNFVLDKQQREGLDFEVAVALAQKSGLAEANPSKDLSGVDAACKLAILLKHLYGIDTKPEELVFSGIENWNLPSWLFRRVRVLGSIFPKNQNEVAAFVLPTFFPAGSHWLGVHEAQNVFEIHGGSGEQHVLRGSGAGGRATASALLNDLNAAYSGWRYVYPATGSSHRLTNEVELEGLLVYDDWEKVPDDFFATVTGRYSGDDFHYMEGRFTLEHLANSKWWKEPGIFLAVRGAMPAPH